MGGCCCFGRNTEAVAGKKSRMARFAWCFGDSGVGVIGDVPLPNSRGWYEVEKTVCARCPVSRLGLRVSLRERKLEISLLVTD